MRNIALGFALLLCGCHKDSPAAPTSDQSDELNDTENLLDGMANTATADNEEGPEQSPGPSNVSN